MLALHRLSEIERQVFVQAVYDAAEVVSVPAVLDPVFPDPDDDPVIQTAIQGKADVLCTLDRHFRSRAVTTFCENHGVQVMSDVELLEELRRIEAESSE